MATELLRADEPQPMETTTAQELKEQFEKLSIKKVVQDSTVLKQIQFETDMAKQKLSIIEKRIMNSYIEVHEVIRQIKNALDVYNDTKSDLSWFSSIIIRELNQFELAERRRLSFDVQAGFVKIEHCKEIVQKKVEMIVVAVIIQALMELSENEWQMATLRTNLRYFIDIILPFVMHVKVFPLIEQTVDGMMNKYREFNRELKFLENYTVSSYNNERSVMDVVEWDDQKGEYTLKSEMKGLVEGRGALPSSKKPCVGVSEAVRQSHN